MKVKEESEKAGLKLNIQQTKTMASGTTLSWQIEVGKVEAMTDFVLLAPKLLWTVTVAMKSKDTCSLEGKLWQNLDSVLKTRDITLPAKVHIVKAMVFPVVLYGCESWTIKKYECWRSGASSVVLEKTLESPLDCSEIKPVNPKGNQPRIVIGRTDAEGEAPTLWPPDAKGWLTGKDRCCERLRAKGEGGGRGWDG